MTALMLAGVALGTASAISGCAGDGLVYDSYARDTHRWNHDDDWFYRRWETTTHRGHADFRRRSAADQQAYWGWRHRS